VKNRRANRQQRPCPTPPGIEVRFFELKESLAEGGSADAYLRRYDEGTRSLVTDTSVIFEVLDDIGDRWGVGRDDGYGYAPVGAYGKAMKLPGDPNWYVFDLHCPPTGTS